MLSCRPTKQTSKNSHLSHELQCLVQGNGSICCLDCVQALYDSTKVIIAIGYIVHNDDSSMRTKLHHCSSIHKTGYLLNNIAAPSWLNNPYHRIKEGAKPVFALASPGCQQSECTTLMPCTSRNIWVTWLVKQKQNLEWDTRGSEKLIDHLFNDHNGCDLLWCKRHREQIKRKSS